MSKAVQCSSSSLLIVASFCQLALKPRFQWQWRMSEQWLDILVVKYSSVLAPILNELNGKVLDSALKSDKVVKANLLTMPKAPTPLV